MTDTEYQLIEEHLRQFMLFNLLYIINSSDNLRLGNVIFSASNVGKQIPAYLMPRSFKLQFPQTVQSLEKKKR